MNRFAVILAGGRGERFWPLSRSARPKQLLSLVGDRPLIAQAVERLEGVVSPDNVFVLTNAYLVEATRAAVPQLNPAQIIGEPVGRDTAPAVALATALVKARAPNAVFAILTADHVIGDLPVFARTLRAAMGLAAERDLLVTIGIRPTEPSTAFGYIELAEPLVEAGGVEFFRAARFVEKPDRARAESYLTAGNFVWNSGMFVWRVDVIERALRTYLPELGACIDEWASAAASSDFTERIRSTFSQAPKISIDYGVMEKANNIAVARGLFAWDDVGSWTALRRHFPVDDRENVFIGDVCAHHSARNIVYSKGRLTALVGIDDAVVVQTEDVTLVCRRDRAEEVKALLARLRETGRLEVL